MLFDVGFMIVLGLVFGIDGVVYCGGFDGWLGIVVVIVMGVDFVYLVWYCVFVYEIVVYGVIVLEWLFGMLVCVVYFL